MKDHPHRHAQNLPRASHHATVGKKHRVPLIALIILGVFLVLPVLAFRALPKGGLWIAAFGLVINAITYGVYAADKKAAQAGLWRTPESTLHLLELAGGWPGAWLAQRRLRHKTAKTSYQMVFWCIVLLHQVVAYDSLQNWKFAIRAGLPLR